MLHARTGYEKKQDGDNIAMCGVITITTFLLTVTRTSDMMTMLMINYFVDGFYFYQEIRRQATATAERKNEGQMQRGRF